MIFSKENQGKEQLQQLAELIDKSNNIVAITGAGISISGGGKTYGQMLLSNARPTTNIKDYLPTYVKNMFRYVPSFSHYALKDLEEEGKLIGIITTNVDCMHTIAGSKNVAEIQGSLQVNCCSNCDKHYDTYEIWNENELPVCEECGGTILPWPLYSHIGLWNDAVKKAQNWISNADLILAVGTHGYFGGAYWEHRNQDAKIVQINPGHTSFDREADLNIKRKCDDVFKELKERQEKANE